MIRIARSAAKQAKRSIIPSVATQTAFSEVICLKSQFDIALLAATSPNSGTIENNVDSSGAAKKILLLVGPESGLSENEEAACRAAGFLPTSLGPRRLRTETAGMIFPALVLHHLGDL
jgi:16S rRNA (uracil1498-N3)-methyltransferase